MIKYKNKEKIKFDEKFDEYIKNYDIHRHNRNTNTKVYALIVYKLNQEFKQIYDSYIDMAFDDRFYYVTVDDYEHIKKNVELNLRLRFEIYMKHHEQYKLINMIKKKYGYPPQLTCVINHRKIPIMGESEEIDKDEFSLEEIRKRTTFGEDGAIYFNKCDD